MRTLPVWLAAALLVVLLVAVMLGRELLRPAPVALPSETPGAWSQPPGPPGDEIGALRDELVREREQRIALSREVAALRLDLDRLMASSGDAEGPTPEPPPGPGSVQREQEAAEGWFDEEGLHDQGMSRSEISSLRQAFEQNELDELYMRDRAVREGWRRSPRYFRELKELRDGLREELGDASYDQLLYASGRNNRTVLGEMLADSPAQSAGLRPGDVVVRYGGQPIFSGRELQQHTAGGRAGASTAIDVLRDGEEIRLYVPRGPLGVRLRSARLPPAPTR